MPGFSFRGQSLEALLRSVLAKPPEQQKLSGFVDLCHKMAVAYLRVKSSAGSFDVRRLGMSIEDFALDSIADLFRCDLDGNLVQFIRFFNSLGRVGESSEDALANHLRRLIFSSVNHRIFQSYRETDSSLARIIRNLKLALKDHPTLIANPYLGETVIRLRGQSGDQHLPQIAPELFAPEFHHRMAGRQSFPEIVDTIGSLLSELEGYQKRISLYEAAEMIRSWYTPHQSQDADRVDEMILSEDEIHSFISTVVEKIHFHTQRSYVRKGKLTEGECTILVAAIRDILIAEFVSHDGEAESLYDTLHRRSPGLTREEYQNRHRVIIEYIAKVARNEMRHQLRKEV